MHYTFFTFTSEEGVGLKKVYGVGNIGLLILSISLLANMPQTALSMIWGKTLPVELVPPQACAIAIFAKGDKRPSYSCSGTLVGPSTILTNIHCVDGAIDIPVPEDSRLEFKVRCQGSPVRDAQLVSSEKHPRGLEGRIYRNQQGKVAAHQDLMTLSFNKSFGLEPMRLVSNRDHKAFLTLIRDKRCVVYGAGKTSPNQSVKKWDVIRVAHANIENSVTSQSRFLLTYFGGDSGIILNGDSGGGLACKDRRGEWVLVGVNEIVSVWSDGKGQIKDDISLAHGVSINLAAHEDRDWMGLGNDDSEGPLEEDIFRFENYLRLLGEVRDSQSCVDQVKRMAPRVSQVATEALNLEGTLRQCAEALERKDKLPFSEVLNLYDLFQLYLLECHKRLSAIRLAQKPYRLVYPPHVAVDVARLEKRRAQLTQRDRQIEIIVTGEEAIDLADLKRPVLDLMSERVRLAGDIPLRRLPNRLAGERLLERDTLNRRWNVQIGEMEEDGLSQSEIKQQLIELLAVFKRSVQERR